MKINSVINLNNSNLKNLRHGNYKQNLNSVEYKKPQSYLPTKMFLSFQGGYTLNLKDTYDNLEWGEYPQDILPAIEKELNFNPSTKKTLYDIHFDKYKEILNCFSLDELKEKFPEFQDVLSVEDVEAKDESFIGRFKNNQLEGFPNDEDLTLQLIKLYWGQGFSLNDLSDYAAQNSPQGNKISLLYTMNKLNIPLMQRHYASVLKLSNKEYNERYTKEMSVRSREAKEEKQQRSEGEAVYIPTVEMTPERRKHISEALKKYYKENPEALVRMSKRQKDFYEQNPKYKEDLSLVMDYAWNKTQEGKSIKKYLSKFLKKYHQNLDISSDELSLKKAMSYENRCALDEFWSKNDWAKEKFSIAVQNGWNYISLHPEASEKSVLNIDIPIPKECTKFDTIPKTLKQKIYNFALSKGYPFKNVTFGIAFFYGDKPVEGKEKFAKQADYAQSVIDEFLNKNPKEADLSTTAKQYALLRMVNILKYNIKSKLPKSVTKEKSQILVQMMSQINKEVSTIFYIDAKGDFHPLSSDFDKVDEFYNAFMYQTHLMGLKDFPEYADKMFDDCYLYSCKMFNDVE